MVMVEIKRSYVEVDLDTPCRVAYWHVDSGRPGPRLLVTSTMHGNEVQGAEVLNRFVAQYASNLSYGSCVLVPFANPRALQLHRPHIDFELGRYYGNDHQNNINTTWPGDPNGNQTHRLADVLFKTFVPDATHLIDLHCWAAAATSVLIHGNHRPSAELARASQFPFVHTISPPVDPESGPVFPCTLNHFFVQTNRPAITVEFDGQYLVKEHEVQRGLRGLDRCLRHLNMLADTTRPLDDEPQLWMDAAVKTEVPSPWAGLFVPSPELVTSQFVSQGQKLGHAISDSTLDSADIVAPVDGYLYTLGRRDPARHGDEFEMRYYHPYTQAGTTVATIVT